MTKFKIVLKDKDSKETDVDYTLYDTTLAVKWFSKIKHLCKVPIDPIESGSEDISNLDEIYLHFCKFADLEYAPLIQQRDQKFYNILHQIYEENHDRLSIRKDNSILYKFHHAIHNHESGGGSRAQIDVGWGVKEGPLTQTMDCQPFYEDNIYKNNLYLPWSELGKTPYTYWANEEPKSQHRFNTLCKPHHTFRVKFFIALYDKKFMPFPNQFNQYFNQFKGQWLKYNNIDDWTERDEWCAPLLAYTDNTLDLREMVFQKIII
jgi:hypothetical protein